MNGSVPACPWSRQEIRVLTSFFPSEVRSQCSASRLTDLDEAANWSLNRCRNARPRAIAKPDRSHDGRFGGGVWEGNIEHAKVVVHLRGIRGIGGGALRRCAAHERHCRAKHGLGSTAMCVSTQEDG